MLNKGKDTLLDCPYILRKVMRNSDNRCIKYDVKKDLFMTLKQLATTFCIMKVKSRYFALFQLQLIENTGLHHQCA